MANHNSNVSILNVLPLMFFSEAKWETDLCYFYPSIWRRALASEQHTWHDHMHVCAQQQTLTCPKEKLSFFVMFSMDDIQFVCLSVYLNICLSYFLSIYLNNKPSPVHKEKTYFLLHFLNGRHSICDFGDREMERGKERGFKCDFLLCLSERFTHRRFYDNESWIKVVNARLVTCYYAKVSEL